VPPFLYPKKFINIKLYGGQKSEPFWTPAYALTAVVGILALTPTPRGLGYGKGFVVNHFFTFPLGNTSSQYKVK